MTDQPDQTQSTRHQAAAGPFAAEREARANIVPDPGWRIRTAEGNRARLLAAVAAAGVELGEFDARHLRWLAGWEDTTVEVVACLIERAYRAGAESVGEVASGD